MQGDLDILRRSGNIYKRMQRWGSICQASGSAVPRGGPDATAMAAATATAGGNSKGSGRSKGASGGVSRKSSHQAGSGARGGSASEKEAADATSVSKRRTASPCRCWRRSCS
ncbi:hypothetical protein VaNZ11_010923 [Volvox africanus]|uniref:Uncharacterized protein n=1 Tax=Volvox africanus TaxID=51714 RepID=A0ABQ5SB97_9CHLO|nr:hypothetical protein VaNZ11_010923 [Volvox africanus]